MRPIWFPCRPCAAGQRKLPPLADHNPLNAKRRMRRFNHWTPRYVWARSQNLISHHVHHDWPWLTPAAVGILETWLRPTDDVFEWGSGRSTLWIAQRAHTVKSIETSEEWLARVRRMAKRKRLRNIDLRLADSRQNPRARAAYLGFLGQGSLFDLVVVDALYRDDCALAALEHLKPAGLLLIDNINWYLPSNSRSPASRRREDGPASPAWARFARRVETWRQIWTSDRVTDTAIWVKPAQ